MTLIARHVANEFVVELLEFALLCTLRISLCSNLS